MQIQTGRQERRVYICAEDGSHYVPQALEWCDVYGKVNVDPANIPQEYSDKIVALGPSFGLRIHGHMSSLWYALSTFRFYMDNPREHFANYYRQLKYRASEGDFQPEPSEDKYIFFAGSLWKKEPETNCARAMFIEVCKSMPNLDFEGGFAPRTHKDVPGYESLTISQRYLFSEYLSRMKRSAIAFNTPAVDRCHGWKLGEFLALGKAIVSTSLSRSLPTPLVHGEHIHYVELSHDSIRQAVGTIIENQSYRLHLENGARSYYSEHLSPEAVVTRILAHAGVPFDTARGGRYQVQPIL